MDQSVKFLRNYLLREVGMITLTEIVRKLEIKQRRKIKKYSYTKNKLDKQEIDDNFICMLQNLTIEELIALKLESIAVITNNKFYFPVTKVLHRIIYRAILLFVLSVTDSESDMKLLLGLDQVRLDKLIRTYNITKYEAKNITREDS